MKTVNLRKPPKVLTTLDEIHKILVWIVIIQTAIVVTGGIALWTMS